MFSRTVRLRTLGIASMLALGVAMAAWKLLPPSHQQLVHSGLTAEAIARMQEFYEPARFLPDFIHCIRVEISPAEFAVYVRTLGLQPGRGIHALPHRCEIPWWTPPDLGKPGGDGGQAQLLVYHHPSTNPEAGEIAVLRDGVLYYVAWNS